MAEGDDDVGDLHAGVVDVVLRLDAVAEPLQAADEGVAHDGVAEVADVRGLVRIDVRVLDDDALAAVASRRHDGADVRRRERAAVEAEVEVAGTLDADRLHERRQGHPVRQRLRDLARLSFERLRQLQRHRRGQVAHV